MPPTFGARTSTSSSRRPSSDDDRVKHDGDGRYRTWVEKLIMKQDDIVLAEEIPYAVTRAPLHYADGATQTLSLIHI